MVKIKKGKSKRSAPSKAAPESSKVTDVPAIIGEQTLACPFGAAEWCCSAAESATVKQLPRCISPMTVS